MSLRQCHSGHQTHVILLCSLQTNFFLHVNKMPGVRLLQFCTTHHRISQIPRCSFLLTQELQHGTFSTAQIERDTCASHGWSGDYRTQKKELSTRVSFYVTLACRANLEELAPKDDTNVICLNSMKLSSLHTHAAFLLSTATSTSLYACDLTIVRSQIWATTRESLM